MYLLTYLLTYLLFGSKSTTSRFGKRFCDDQYSLVSFLFAVLLLTVPPVPHGVGAPCMSTPLRQTRISETRLTYYYTE